jgi:hypothetical protein
MEKSEAKGREEREGLTEEVCVPEGNLAPSVGYMCTRSSKHNVLG